MAASDFKSVPTQRACRWLSVWSLCLLLACLLLAPLGAQAEEAVAPQDEAIVAQDEAVAGQVEDRSTDQDPVATADILAEEADPAQPEAPLVLEAEAPSDYTEDLLAAGNTMTFKIYGTVNTSVGRQLLPLVNEQRRKAGVGTLVWDTKLEQIAAQRAAEIAFHYSDRHLRPDGSSCKTALPGNTTASTENIGYHSGGGAADVMHNLWTNSPGHYRNMTNASVTMFGAAQFVTQTGAGFWVEVFAAGWDGSGLVGSPIMGRQTYAVTAFTSLVSGNLLEQQGCHLRDMTAVHEGDATYVVGEEGKLVEFVRSNDDTGRTYPHAFVPLDPSSCSFASSNTGVVTVDSSGNVRAVGEGTATVTVKMTANQSVTDKVTITVVGDIAQASVELDDSYYDYTGEPVEAGLTVSMGSYTLVEGTDYTVSYRDNVEAGTATATVTGRGTFYGSKDIQFDIDVYDVNDVIEDGELWLVLDGWRYDPGAEFAYTGQPITPKLVFYKSSDFYYDDFEEGSEYEVTYQNNIDASTATATLVGKGMYSGSISVDFEIVRVSIAQAKMVAESGELAMEPRSYTGKPITPKPTLVYNGIVLTEGKDYTLSYEDNTKVGWGRVTWSGKGNFGGSNYCSFKIVESSSAKTDITSATVSTITDQAYTGKALTPAPVVKMGSTTLRNGTDYSLTYDNNVEAGIATVTVAGKGSYVGRLTRNFNIVAQAAGIDLSQVTVDPIASQSYTGKAITPAVTVRYGSKTLAAGTDYTASYKDNVNVGTATVTLTGKGAYKGSKTVKFSITAPNLANATIAAISEQAYTGKAVMPSLTVKLGGKTLAAGTDYFVVYRNNVKRGTATVLVTGMGNYVGSKTASFKIGTGDLSKATIASIADQAYTGKAVTPTPAVQLNGQTLVAGTDYTLSYKNNVNKGTATVTATGKGNYAGAVSKQFNIVEKAAVKTQEMYRLYNPHSGEHFYTAKAGERDYLVKVGWNYEGVGWIAPVDSKTPVYRLYNGVAGDHHYTMKAGERDFLVGQGWKYEGVGWYSDDAKGTPLYRQYNPNAKTGSHNYTTNKRENDFLVTHGWVGEGVGWYGVK